MVLLKNKCWAGEFRHFQNSVASGRLSLNSDYVKDRNKLTNKLSQGLDANAKKKLILSHIDAGEEEDFTIDLTEIKDTLPVTWEHFNHNFIDVQANYKEVEDIVDENLDKRMDLRPYMLQQCHYVHPRDGL